MPICSYIIFPEQGHAENVEAALASTPHCEVQISENDELMILVTDTATPEEEADLSQRLKCIDHVNNMVMTFGSVNNQSISTETSHAVPGDRTPGVH